MQKRKQVILSPLNASLLLSLLTMAPVGADLFQRK